MIDKILYLSDSSFKKDILQSKGTFLVYFWAEWCSHCKIIAPILAEIADELDNQLTIAKLDIEKNPLTAPKYGIRSIPTLLLFRNGKTIATRVGSLSKKQLKNFIESNI
ncbi:Thioredoxin-1 [Candidatus Mikella endobia]|uniref:Thioredoxin n=1 Tax=Candidatus Mikella endobia TaxID=1778264 RepID=A0A143WQP1_9ENTR|nr:thioredoxin TrxA [Candidatus Mikella endobia]CUX95931.1 Thioredoxin-1 [Candidatus Mikella endobia]